VGGLPSPQAGFGPLEKGCRLDRVKGGEQWMVRRVASSWL
jgi:hypothetical protein